MLNEPLSGPLQGKNLLQAIRYQSIRLNRCSFRNPILKMRHQGPAIEKLDAAKRSSDRTRLPVRTANTSLPAIGEPQRKARQRRDSTPAKEADGPFDTTVLTDQVKAVANADERRWPRLPGLSHDRINELESTVENLREELSERCVQIADLHNIQQQQAAALMIARTAIETLEASVDSLQQTITQRENEVAAAKQELLASVQEKNALGGKLEDTERELAEVLQKLLHLSTAMNDKEVALISAEERVTALEQELIAKTSQDDTTQEPIPDPTPAFEDDQDQQAEQMAALEQESTAETAQDETKQDQAAEDKAAQEPAPAPAIEDDQKQHRDEITEQSIQFESRLERLESMLAAEDERIDKLNETNAKLCEHSDALDKSQAQFESRIKTLESALAARDGQIDKLRATNAELSERCDALTHSNLILESGRKHTQEKLKSQTSDIKLLEAAVLAGRKTADQRIVELTGELQREREAHAAAARESATIRKEITLLLSKLDVTAPSIQ